MRKQSVLLLSLAAFVSILLVATAMSYELVIKPRNELDEFLRNTNAVEIGTTTPEHWREQLQKERVTKYAVICREGSCGISMRRENGFLARLRLAPKTVASAGVDFRNGVASEIYILMVVMRRNDEGQMIEDKGVVVRESTDRPTSCNQNYDVRVHQRYGNGDRYWATVAMDRCVNMQDRARAIAINTHCLTRIGGCKSVEGMLPKVLGGQSN